MSCTQLAVAATPEERSRLRERQKAFVRRAGTPSRLGLACSRAWPRARSTRTRSLLKLCSTHNRADMPTAVVLAVSGAPRVAQRVSAKRAIAKPAALRRSTRSCAQGRTAVLAPKVRRVRLRRRETSD